MTAIERLVVFSIFMENGRGIVGKAPEYIMEKWGLAQAHVNDEYIIAGLDQANQAKYREWQRVWKTTAKKEVDNAKTT